MYLLIGLIVYHSINPRNGLPCSGVSAQGRRLFAAARYGVMFSGLVLFGFPHAFERLFRLECGCALPRWQPETGGNNTPNSAPSILSWKTDSARKVEVVFFWFLSSNTREVPGIDLGFSVRSLVSERINATVHCLHLTVTTQRE